MTIYSLPVRSEREDGGQDQPTAWGFLRGFSLGGYNGVSMKTTRTVGANMML